MTEWRGREKETRQLWWWWEGWGKEATLLRKGMR